MATTKKKEVTVDADALNEEQKAASKSINDMLRNFISANSDIEPDTEEKPELLPTGMPTLDVVLGGGVIMGGFIQLYGRPGCGKSSFAIKIMSAFQKAFNYNCASIYIDAETAMTNIRLKQLGVRNVLLYNQCTLESVFDIIKNNIKFKQDNPKLAEVPFIIIWDSIPTTISEKETGIEDPKQVVGYRANLLKTYLYQVKADLRKYRITLIAINQTRDSINMGFTPAETQIKGIKQADHIPGGKALLYATDQMLQMHDTADLVEEKTGFNGKEIMIKAIKNKAFAPGIECKTAFSFVGGYSGFWSAFFTLASEGLLSTTAGFYQMAGYENKFRAKAALELYKKDEKFKNAFNAAIRTFGERIVNQYKQQQELVNSENVFEENGGSNVNIMVDDSYDNASAGVPKAIGRKPVKGKKAVVEPEPMPDIETEESQDVEDLV